MVPLTKCHDGPYVPPRSNFYTTSHTLVAAPEEYEQYIYMKSAGHVFAQGPSMGIPPPQYDEGDSCSSVKKGAEEVYDEIPAEYLQVISNQNQNLGYGNIPLEIPQTDANGSEDVYDNDPPTEGHSSPSASID